jgi:hypothetical protein
LCDAFLEKNRNLKLMFPGDAAPKVSNYNKLQEGLPIMETLMENGSMARIASNVLGEP